MCVVPTVEAVAGELDQLACYSDAELAALLAAARDEQRRRAAAAADPDALVEDGFASGFTAAGEVTMPWLAGGVLVCPGGWRAAGRLNHRCTFVSVAGTWVWDAPEALCDRVRRLEGRSVEMRSVTLVGAYEGLEYDVVESRTRSGVHHVVKARSFRIVDGKPELVTTRTSPTAVAHRS